MPAYIVPARARRIAVCALLSLLAVSAHAEFTIAHTGGQLTIYEDGAPVLVYNHGLVYPPEGVDAERYARSSYIHPLYGLDGAVITEDFPADHYHHRGVFWTWPETVIGGRKMDVWTLVGARQVYERWLLQEVEEDQVTVGVENGWFFDGEHLPKVRETIHFTVHPAAEHHRAIDFKLRFTNVCQEDVVFEGAKDKGYGGFSFRPRAENKPFVFDTAQGVSVEDALSYDTPWASVRWEKEGAPSPGVAIFQHPSNPGFPHPGWIFRHYAFLGVCWPHEQTHVLKPGDFFELQYRLLVHQGVDAAALAELFDAYVKQNEAGHGG
ncbi:MAG: PmoA family protein [Candidatus Hydrogenedentes bacterium]|nr:PmoA family protein [Candidatus Hydrogenedentota bacterium]